MMEVPTIAAPSPRRIALAAAGALLLAAVVLVVAVLPAGYGIDLLGTGKALGLLDLYEGAKADPETAPAPAAGPVKPPTYRTQTVEFKLRPHEGFEYKYRVEKGRGFVYSWTATGRAKSEFHGEHDGAPAGTAVTYDKQEGDWASGTFTAPAGGIHGWFWENLGDAEMTIKLTSAGFYDWADEFRVHFDMAKHKNKVERTRHELAGPTE